MRYSWRRGRQKEPQQGIVKRKKVAVKIHININIIKTSAYFYLAHYCILIQYLRVFLGAQDPLQVPLSDGGAR